MEARPLAGNLVLRRPAKSARRARLPKLVNANIVCAAGHHLAKW